MRTSIFLTAVLAVTTGLAMGDFVYHAPTDRSGIGYFNIECQWVGYTNWYGYCAPQTCPSSFLGGYSEVVRSNGWDSVILSVIEFFDRNFGTINREEDVLYRDYRSRYSDFGAPCFTGGEKRLCCKSGFAGAVSLIKTNIFK